MINKTINFSYASREPTREWVYEDGEQDEIYLPELEPEEEDNPSVSFSNQHKNIMKTLYQLFPQKCKLISGIYSWSTKVIWLRFLYSSFRS